MRADNSWYLSIVATIFLPISYLASLFGITTLTWPAIWYLWAAIPIVAVSLTLALCFPWGIRRLQKRLYPIETLRLTLRPQSFTMLGNELPDNVDVPGSRRPSKVGRKSQRPAGVFSTRSRSRVRMQTRQNSDKSEEG